MRRKPHVLVLALTPMLAAATGMAGCADLTRASRLQPEALNVESPAAAAVLAVQSERLPRPSFRDVPAKPTDLPKPQGYANRIARLNAEHSQLNAWAADNPALLDGTEDYAAATRRTVGATNLDAPPPDSVARTEAWAKRMRDAAKPPPPVSAPPAP